MKEITYGILIFLFVAAMGYAQESKQFLQLNIQSRQTHYVGENINLLLDVRNLSSQGIPFCEPKSCVEPIIVIFDGKEYKRNTNAWGARANPIVIPSKEGMNFSIDLIEYDIIRDVTTLGKHTIAVKINEAISNLIIIEVKKRMPVWVEGQKVGLDLQDGFSGRKVIIRVNNKIIFEGNPKTDERIGFAGGTTFHADTRFIDLNIQVPSERLNSTMTIDLNKARGIGISIQEGKVSIIPRDGFGYD